MFLLLFVICLLTQALAADIGNESNHSIGFRLDTENAPLAQPSFQLDVLFPLPNGVYRRTEKFPIIFGTTGLEYLWLDVPGLRWELRAISNDKGTKDAQWTIEDQRSWGFIYDYIETPVHNMLIFNSSDAPKRSKATRWQLHYYFQHVKNTKNTCLIGQTDEGWRMRLEGDPDSVIEGSFNFTIKDDAPPFVFSNDMCGQPLGTVGYIGRSSVVACPVALDYYTPPLECRTRLNDTGFAEIYSQFGDGMAGCGFSNSSAPNSSRIPCRQTTVKGDAVLVHPGMTSVLATVVMFGVYVAFGF